MDYQWIEMSGEGESVTNIAKSQGSDKVKTPKAVKGLILHQNAKNLEIIP